MKKIKIHYILMKKRYIFKKPISRKYENKERDDGVKIDKLYNELSFLNEKDNIFSKLFYDEKENNDKFDGVNQKNKELLNLKEKENIISKNKFEIKRETIENDDKIIIDKIDKESSHLNKKQYISSKNIFEEK